MSIKDFILTITCLLLSVGNVFAQTTRQLVLEVPNKDGQPQKVEFYTGSYALVIGASNYQNPAWQRLRGVAEDAKAVRSALEKQGFTVEQFNDPTSETLLPRFNKFVNDYGFVKTNRLLIYFAGHGYTYTDAETGGQFGYIVPIDAPNPQRDLIAFQQRAVSMDEIENLARRIQSRHAMFIFDSCFSGTLISREGGTANKFVNYLTAKPVRQFITSGAANQAVPDVSIFRQMFVKALEGEADANKDGYITGSELAAYLQERVIFYSKQGQTPQYGKLRDPRLDGGDFVFISPLKPAVTGQSEVVATAPIINAAALRQFIRWDTMIARSEFDTVQREATAELLRTPTNALALRMRSEACLRLNQNECFMNDANAVLKLLKTPTTAEEYQTRGYAHSMLGLIDEAISDSNKSIELNPDSASAHVMRGSIYTEQKHDLDKGIIDLNKAIELDPNYAQAYLARGFFYDQKGEIDKSIADFSKGLELSPKFITAYISRSYAYVKKRDYDRAIADASKYIELSPKDSGAYNARAYVYKYKGDYERALSDVNKAIELKPNGGTYYDSRGEFYLDLKEYDKAIVDLTKAIELSSGNPIFIETYQKRAKAYDAKGETAKAAADRAKAAELEKAKEAAYYSQRGYINQEKGDYDRALADLTKAIELAPQDSRAYNLRAYAYKYKGDYDRALSDANKAIEIKPNDGNYYDSRGEFYLDLKEYDKAIVDLTKAVELSPTLIESYQKRAKAYDAKGETTKAAADRTKAAELEKAQQPKQK